mmetsp:Transcript_18457/g.69837  ORF Transcript_18457/g.69837 Transcript_18457/m.69837 type:complete len:222 (-) Transcript_18457:240-905(-)
MKSPIHVTPNATKYSSVTALCKTKSVKRTAYASEVRRDRLNSAESAMPRKKDTRLYSVNMVTAKPRKNIATAGVHGTLDHWEPSRAPACSRLSKTPKPPSHPSSSRCFPCFFTRYSSVTFVAAYRNAPARLQRSPFHASGYREPCPWMSRSLTIVRPSPQRQMPTPNRCIRLYFAFRIHIDSSIAQGMVKQSSNITDVNDVQRNASTTRKFASTSKTARSA